VGHYNTRLGIAAQGLGALDEPYRLAKPTQRSCFTVPPGYLRVFSKLTLFIVWRHITFILILDKENLQTKVAAMPSSLMNFCRVPDLKKCVKLKFASEISIRKMNHKKPTLVK
jgi:hypothetical protein